MADTTGTPDTGDTAPIDTTGRPVTTRRLDPGSEWFWPAVNLIGLVVVVAVNALANITQFNGMSTGEVVNRDPVHFQPAGWTFSIWSVIYALLAAFVVYSFLQQGRADRRVRLVSVVFLVTNIANASWIVFWHYEQWGITLALITLLLVALILIYYLLRRRRGAGAQPPTMERLMVWTPFSVYLGWVSVATLSNVAVWSDRTGTPIWGLGERGTAVLFLGILLAATLLMSTWMRDPTYAVVIAWAALGITVEQWDRSGLVATAAAVTTLLAIGLAIFGSLLAFELRHKRHVLPEAAQAGDHRRFWQRSR